jgi:hypothetical protein
MAYTDPSKQCGSQCQSYGPSLGFVCAAVLDIDDRSTVRRPRGVDVSWCPAGWREVSRNVQEVGLGRLGILENISDMLGWAVVVQFSEDVVGLAVL